MRLSIPSNKEQIQYWKQFEKKVLQALEKLNKRTV